MNMYYAFQVMPTLKRLGRFEKAVDAILFNQAQNLGRQAWKIQNQQTEILRRLDPTGEIYEKVLTEVDQEKFMTMHQEEDDHYFNFKD